VVYKHKGVLFDLKLDRAYLNLLTNGQKNFLNWGLGPAQKKRGFKILDPGGAAFPRVFFYYVEDGFLFLFRG